MRLWHYKLLPYLSELQFKGQLRELILIMRDWKNKGYTNHILINIVTEYPKSDLKIYYKKYREEYYRRYQKYPDNKYDEEFDEFCPEEVNINDIIFRGWHDEGYLRVCLANLYEKHIYGRGNSRISKTEMNRICEGYQLITGKEWKIKNG